MQFSFDLWTRFMQSHPRKQLSGMWQFDIIRKHFLENWKNFHWRKGIPQAISAQVSIMDNYKDEAKIASLSATRFFSNADVVLRVLKRRYKQEAATDEFRNLHLGGVWNPNISPDWAKGW
jgi:hypothetical protein